MPLPLPRGPHPVSLHLRRGLSRADLFPPGIALVEADLSNDEPLAPAEEQAVSTASPHRRQEFRAGRAAARAALAVVGRPGAVLPRGADRRPVWPSGFVGSISHCPGFCGAAAASTRDFAGVGFDAEARRRVGPHLHAAVCTEDERAWMARAGGDDEMATLIFSAKEAVYKCLSPLTGARLGFADVTIEPAGDGAFVASVRLEVPVAYRRLTGRFVFEPGHVLTGVAVATAR